MRPGGDRDLALAAKNDKDKNNEENYNRECEEIAEKLDRYKDNFKIDDQIKLTQENGLTLIDSFQWILFNKYLEEINGN